MGKKLTEQDFINWIEEHNIPIEYLSGYKSTSEHCTVKCLKCGYIWQVKPANIKQGKGCKKCADRNLSKYKTISLGEFNKWLLDNDRTDLECISGYVDTRTTCNFKCTKCGNIWGAIPNNIKKNRHCPVCSYKLIGKKNSLPKSDFVDYIDRQRKDIKYISGYISTTVKCKFECSFCHHVFKMRPKNLRRGESCPQCCKSHGENFIGNYLDKNNLSYEYQKKFMDLYDVSPIHPLSYDFYLPKYNLLIEYQGIQHYSIYKSKKKKTLPWKMTLEEAIDQLAKQNLHDDMKRYYAKSHGYSLLEIPYTVNTQEKVDKYLSDYLDV